MKANEATGVFANISGDAAYTKYCKLVNAQLVELGKLLQAHANEPGIKNYAHVGDMAHAHEELANLIAFFKGEEA